MMAIIMLARSDRDPHSSRACFSDGSNGQIMASDVTSLSSGVDSMASQFAEMP